jgi:hypothetical protein
MTSIGSSDVLADAARSALCGAIPSSRRQATMASSAASGVILMRPSVYMGRSEEGSGAKVDRAAPCAGENVVIDRCTSREA